MKLSDDDVYRQLQRLLTVEPSPTFVPRLRMGVAAASVKSDAKGVFFAAGRFAAAAALVIAISIYVSAPARHESAVAASRSAAVPSVAPSSDSSEPRVTSSAAAAARRLPIPSIRSSNRPSVPPERAIPVIVSADEVQAFDRFVRSATDGTVSLSFEETNRERAIAELTIPPVVVKPAGNSEEGGVDQ